MLRSFVAAMGMLLLGVSAAHAKNDTCEFYYQELGKYGNHMVAVFYAPGSYDIPDASYASQQLVLVTYKETVQLRKARWFDNNDEQAKAFCKSIYEKGVADLNTEYTRLTGETFVYK